MPVATAKPDKHGSSKPPKDDTKLKPTNVQKPVPVAAAPEPAPAPAPAPDKGGGVPDSKAAMAAYKNRDFATAKKAYLAEAMNAKDGATSQKLIAASKQVENIANLITAAGNDEKSAPDKAAKEYEDAIALDQKISKGALGSFLKSKIGGISVQAAKQAFSNQKFDQAYTLALQAQKAGAADAGGVLKQLNDKAGELVAKAQGMQKTQPDEAKKLARQVQKMVPAGSPNYTKAYQIVNSSGAPRRDEDE